MTNPMNSLEHICAFNDGEQSCDCYNAGLQDAEKVANSFNVSHDGKLQCHVPDNIAQSIKSLRKDV